MADSTAQVPNKPPGPGRKALVTAMRVAIVAIPLITIGALLVPWLVAAGMYLTGRASICSFRQTLESARIAQVQYGNTERIRTDGHLVREDAAGFHLWETALGAYWVPAASDNALQYDLGEQMRDIYGKGPTGVHQGDVVLDCGANVGVFTKKAIALGARLVVAIEPAPENLECLRRNLATEIAGGRVILYPKGVWDREDVLTMHIDRENSAADSFVRKLAGDQFTEQKLPVTTVDHLVRELKLPEVNFIKMDIEGSEQKALAGARDTIARFRPRMAICTYHMPDDPVNVPKIVGQAKSDYRTECQCLLERSQVISQVIHFF